MFLNVLFRSIVRDTEITRAQAFVKRLLQVRNGGVDARICSQPLN